MNFTQRCLITFLILSSGIGAPVWGQDVGSPEDPQFRLDIIRQSTALPLAQRPPYDWSAVYLENAFQENAITNFQLDSSICSQGIAGGNQFIPNIRVQYQYNSAGDPTTITYHKLTSGGSSAPFSQKTYSYLDGKVSEYLYSTWDDNQSVWSPSYRESTQYLPNGKPESFRTEEFNVNWQGIQQEKYSYHAEGFLSKVVTQSWTGNAWQDSLQQDISYNDLGAFTEIIQSSWNGQAWENVSRINASHGFLGLTWLAYQLDTWQNGSWLPAWRESYSYNQRGYWTEMERAQWDNSSNQWELKVREEFDYNGKGIWTGWASFTRQDSTWIQQARRGFQVNAGIRQDVLQSWNNSQSAWENDTRALAQYNNDNKRVREAAFQIWDGSSWVNGAETRDCQHFWSQATTSRAEVPPTAACLLPNPYRLHQSISCEALSSEKWYQVQLRDLQGRSIYDDQIKGKETFQIDQGVTPGLYQFLILDQGSPVLNQKLLIQP